MPPALGTARGRGRSAILDGVRFIRRSPVILGTFVIDLAAMVFGLPWPFAILALETFTAVPPPSGS